MLLTFRIGSSALLLAVLMACLITSAATQPEKLAVALINQLLLTCLFLSLSLSLCHATNGGEHFLVYSGSKFNTSYPFHPVPLRSLLLSRVFFTLVGKFFLDNQVHLCSLRISRREKEGSSKMTTDHM